MVLVGFIVVFAAIVNCWLILRIRIFEQHACCSSFLGSTFWRCFFCYKGINYYSNVKAMIMSKRGKMYSMYLTLCF